MSFHIWKLIIPFVMCLLLTSIAFAAKDIYVYPQEEGAAAIIYPESLIYQQGKPAHFAFDVLNLTGFKMNSSQTNCSFDSVDNNGNSILHTWANYNTTHKYWTVRLNATHLKNLGTYGWYVHCNGSDPYSAAAASYVYLVTPDGQADDVKDTTAGIAIILFLSFLIACIFMVGFKVDFVEGYNANATIKTSVILVGMYLISLTLALLGSLADAANLTIISELHTLLYISNVGIYVGMILVALLFLFRVITNYNCEKDKKRMGDGE